MHDAKEVFDQLCEWKDHGLTKFTNRASPQMVLVSSLVPEPEMSSVVAESGTTSVSIHLQSMGAVNDTDLCIKMMELIYGISLPL